MELAGGIRGTGVTEHWIGLPHQSALMLRARITLPHFSVSSAIILPKSAGESASTSPPRSARRALILGSARPALISLLSFSTISAGVAFGAPNQARGDVVPAASGGRNDHAHRPRRIGLRASNPRHGRQRARADEVIE